jgi:hypothetical protein
MPATQRYQDVPFNASAQLATELPGSKIWHQMVHRPTARRRKSLQTLIIRVRGQPS